MPNHTGVNSTPTPNTKCENDTFDRNLSNLLKSNRDQPDNTIHTTHTCNICKIVYIAKTDLDEHSLAHKGQGHYKCLDCSFKTTDRKQFTSHILTKAHMKDEINGGKTRKSFAEAVKKSEKILKYLKWQKILILILDMTIKC